MFTFNEEGDIVYYNFFEAVLEGLYRLFGGDYSSFYAFFRDVGLEVLAWYLLIATMLSVILVVFIVVIYRKVTALSSVFSISSDVLVAGDDIPIARSSERWEHVLELLGSDNPNDWRLSILEADIMLDELVTKMGYRGETLGEKLKNIEKADFRTLDDAWEAHKIRNIIAHRGSDYVLTQREARRTIDLFARVFEEFHYI